jgi:3-oxoacyl-[acyl-carrier-protein] synthase III
MRTEQMPRSWRDARSVSLLGMGTALPGPPVPTDELLDRLQSRFEVDVRRQGLVLAARLGIRTRHICRDFTPRHEAPRGGDTNAELAARALQAALSNSGLEANDLSYLVGHTTTPGRLLPANIANVADLIGYQQSDSTNFMAWLNHRRDTEGLSTQRTRFDATCDPMHQRGICYPA